MLVVMPSRALGSGQQDREAQISTSTVAAIGGGFIALAILFGGVLTIIRMLRISRRVEERRQRGETVTFSQQWEWEGGLWGFLFGVSARDFHEAVTGRPSRANRAARDQRRKERRPKQERPELVDFQVPRRGDEGVMELRGPGDEPLSIVAAGPSAEEEPILDMSVFILLPTPPEAKERRPSFNIYEDDEYDDFPEIVIGTTNVYPYTSLPSSDWRASYASTCSDEPACEEGEKGKSGTVEQVEFAQSGPRRARWIKDEKQWTLEGL